LIDHEGEQKGIMGLDKAKKLAKQAGLDLVEVSPQANPPVCKIMDYGKHLYKMKKSDQAHKKAQKQTEVKGVRITLRISDHDLKTKIKQAERFLGQKNLVKVSLMFKGRELAHTDLGFEKMGKIKEILAETASVDMEPKRQGNTLIMILSPKNK